MNLSTRLALVFLSFISLLLLGVGVMAYTSGRGGLQAATLTELESTSLEKRAALDTWIADRKGDITALANSPAVLEDLAAMLASGPDSTAEHARLVRQLAVRAGLGQPFQAFLILSPETGEVLAATNSAEEGKFREYQPYFIQGKSAPFVSTVYYSIELQAPAITASAPLRTEAGKLLGVLAGRLDLQALSAIIQRRSGLRQTDDAFLVNTSNLFVTQPRLLPDPAVLRRGIHTEAVKQCLATHSSGTFATVDYRGISSLIDYHWLPDYEMCLIVKVDEAEALAPVHSLGKAIAGIGVIALMVAAVLALAVSRTIVRPILEMQTAAQRYGRGYLDMRLPERRLDELGMLAREFNQMAAALAAKELELRAHAQTLEQKVQERTRELRDSNTQLLRAEQIGQIGSWEWRIAEDRVTWSEGLYKLFGLSPQEFGATYAAYLAQVHPDDREYVRQTLSAAQQAGGAFEFESRVCLPDGQVRHIHTRGEMSPDGPARMIGLAIDITQRKQAEEALARRSDELQRSNDELQQFAYVASHDLQEPLRMVSSYVQLLGKRYQGQLDPDADEFIGYAVEGAARMRNLINDLLAYSRVGSHSAPLMPVSCEEVLAEALFNLQLTIEESGAIITHEPLPTVHGDATQLASVFQNLLGNAIKFRGPLPPQVHIAASRAGHEWLFVVADNGMGIDPRYSERIFVIFQRLHDRASYPGTGIGLAICKRIIQRHGGRIWVESQPGQGAAFHFTLPAKEAL
jgi:PAS domain S-box-containing protein